MAKFSYTQNGILFNNLDNAPIPIKKVTGKIFNSNNDYEHAADGIDMTIDAVTIDWNSAQMGNLTTGEQIIIDTTGQLLSYISTISQKITNLEKILSDL